MYFQKGPDSSTQFLELFSGNRNKLKYSGMLSEYAFPESSRKFQNVLLHSYNKYNVTGMNLNIQGCLGTMNFQKLPEISRKFKIELEYSELLRDYVFPGNSRMFYSILRINIM